MNRFLALLKPPLDAPLMNDSKEIDASYKYWRIRTLYSTFIGYALYYFTRKSLTYATPGLMQDLSLDMGQIGLLSSIFYITYGISKFTSGILSDRSNPRYFMALGLIVTGFINIFFGMSSSLFLFAILWCLNGWFQGFGWPPCARYLSYWYSQNERGSWWSIWNVSNNVGSFIIPWIIAVTMYYYGWRYAMYVPGVLCIFGGLFLINRLRDTPASLGLPPVDKWRNDEVDIAATEVGNTLSTKEIFLKYVIKNKFIWILSVAYFFLYTVRIGFSDWMILFLVDEKDYTRMAATGNVSLFEVGGFFGSLCAGWVSDKLFSAKRGPVNMLYALSIALFIGLFWLMPAGAKWIDSLLIFLVGFSVFGPQMLIGVAAAELSHKRAAATSTGFAGCFAYLGAAAGGYPLGKITDTLGWNVFFATLMGCCFMLIIFLAPLWSVTKSPDYSPKKKEAEFA